MADRFDIQRSMDNAAEDLVESARERLEAKGGSERERRLIKLSVGYYYDPLEKAILRKAGGRLIFVRYERRQGVRKTQAEAEKRQFRMIAGGLFWDEKAKKLYRRAGQHFVLYTGDRRKAAERRKSAGRSTQGKERRSKR